MAVATMSDGFLGRWSKRKLEVKEGKAVEEPVQTQAEPSPQPSPAGGRGGEVPGAVMPAPSPLRGEGRGEGQSAEAPPPPTLEDVKFLTADSDFARFARPDVSPDVKNAAMKKLFSDPRYNVMDGLDVYTGDYSQPDPIPYPMLRKLASAKFLGLFDLEEKQEAEAAEAARQARDVADNPTTETVAQSEPAPLAVPEPPDHADADLRLQQDDAAPGKDPGRGAE
jgi:hypothetical protein